MEVPSRGRDKLRYLKVKWGWMLTDLQPSPLWLMSAQLPGAGEARYIPRVCRRWPISF